ncbi:MAG: diguanylate cyclase [Pusillimonas sp.]|nr:diguanylate cyclase [Pusillimonas sp.]
MTPTCFSDCLTAQLEFLGKIQDHGTLLVADENDVIVAAAENAGNWLGKAANDMLGRPWMALFPQIHPPSSLNSFEAIGLSGIHLHPVRINNTPLIMARHRTNGRVVIEFEAESDTNTFERDRGAILAACLSQIGRTDSEQAAAECLMRFIAMVTGFDRVLVLQFLPNWHGKVIAETLKPGVSGHLNHHFPANDIPENARRLYTRKLQRLITDAHTETVHILSTLPHPIDLTYAELRAVHPVHIQYMKNMNVTTSFSVSIVLGDTLWGLVPCHNLKGKSLSFADRQLCEHLSRIAGLHMSGLAQLRHAKERHTHLLMRRQLRQDIQANGANGPTFQRQLQQIRETFIADGAWLRYQERDFFDGTVPSAQMRTMLLNWLATQTPEPVIARHELDDNLKENEELRKTASGLLRIELNRNEFLILMRKEQSAQMEWAGHPQEKAHPDDPKAALSPRTSFETWRQLVQGIATPWAASELESALRLRTSLNEVFEFLELEQQSLTDALTGLGNRNQLNRTLSSVIAQYEQTDGRMAALMIDLDDFKPVNDQYGHSIGDEVLIKLAQRMKALLRETDVLVRLGGDEFAIVLTRVRAVGDPERLADRLLKSISQPVTLDNGEQIEITASIGAALYPDHARAAADLLHRADLAMYAVKRRNRCGFELYDQTTSYTASRNTPETEPRGTT